MVVWGKIIFEVLINDFNKIGILNRLFLILQLNLGSISI